MQQRSTGILSFDISSDQKDMMKTRRVSNRKCYLLYALKPVGSCKVRNLFQFDPETKDYQLVLIMMFVVLQPLKMKRRILSMYVGARLYSVC